MAQDFAALMARYCDGDVSALGELYATTAPQLLSYLKRIVHDRALAEDILQETYLKLQVTRHSYIYGADPMPLLYTIARRKAVDELRRIRNREQSPCDVEGLPPRDGSVWASSPSDVDPERHERLLDGLIAGLDKLPASQRAIIVLTRLEGKSVPEVAQRFGTSAGAIRARTHRGYRALRRLLRSLQHLAAAAFILSGAKSAASSRSGNPYRDEGVEFSS